jgi:D-alanyl-D-alanine carboxypeptidase (penicillin-binding protein 5/6)
VAENRWNSKRRLCVGLFALMIAALLAAAPAAHATYWSRYHHSHHHRHHYHHRVTHHAPAVMYHAALLEDADTGRVLYAVNQNLSWPPASMAKMMLLLVTTDAIKSGRLSYNTPVRISYRSAMTGGSRLGLREGQVYPLGELMKAALIKSANDAAVAIGETVGGGSIDGAVRLMNAKAAQLGMTDTHYETVDGLPPRPMHDVDRTTALDLATLARALIHTTNLLQWSSLRTAEFDGGVAFLHNTNHLVGRYYGCDGLKTGFTYEAGFNLTATAKRGDMRLISVILGAPNNPERFIQSAKLLDWGFNNFEKVEVLHVGQTLPAVVQLDNGQTIHPVPENNLSILMPKRPPADIRYDYEGPSVVTGPLPAGTLLGKVAVMDGSEVLTKVDVYSPVAVGMAPATLNATTVRSDAPSATMPDPK